MVAVADAVAVCVGVDDGMTLVVTVFVMAFTAVAITVAVALGATVAVAGTLVAARVAVGEAGMAVAVTVGEAGTVIAVAVRVTLGIVVAVGVTALVELVITLVVVIVGAYAIETKRGSSNDDLTVAVTPTVGVMVGDDFVTLVAVGDANTLGTVFVDVTVAVGFIAVLVKDGIGVKVDVAVWVILSDAATDVAVKVGVMVRDGMIVVARLGTAVGFSKLDADKEPGEPHVQPVPYAPENVTPLGRVSVNVIGPVVEPGPRFVTCNTYVSA